MDDENEIIFDSFDFDAICAAFRNLKPAVGEALRTRRSGDDGGVNTEPAEISSPPEASTPVEHGVIASIDDPRFQRFLYGAKAADRARHLVHTERNRTESASESRSTGISRTTTSSTGGRETAHHSTTRSHTITRGTGHQRDGGRS